MKRRLQLGLKETCKRIEFSYLKFLRWRRNCLLKKPAKKKPGPKKLELPNWLKVKQEINELKHCHSRTHGVGKLIRKYSGYISRREFRKLVRLKRFEVKRERRRAQDKILYQKVNAIWSIDDSMVFRDENGGKMTMHVLRDLASKYQFAKPSQGLLSGEDVAKNLEVQIKKYGAPLFLKSDLGLNLLKCKSMMRVLKKYLIIPIPSPGYYPQYNGSLERGNGEIKAHIAAETIRDWKEDTQRFFRELAIPVDAQNHEPRRILGSRCSCEVFHSKRMHSKWTRKERKFSFDWIIQQTKTILNNEYVRGFKDKDFWDAWRKASLAYLELEGYVKVEKGTDVSTTFSSNCYH